MQSSVPSIIETASKPSVQPGPISTSAFPSSNSNTVPLTGSAHVSAIGPAKTPASGPLPEPATKGVETKAVAGPGPGQGPGQGQGAKPIAPDATEEPAVERSHSPTKKASPEKRKAAIADKSTVRNVCRRLANAL